MRNASCDQLEKSERLSRANEEKKEDLSHLCGIYVGLASANQAEMPHHFGSSPFMNGARVSTGIGKMVVEFFSPAISTSVCRYRS